MVRTAGPAVFWRNGNASGMAYEEASVAGETPDRSKQRKSSGNPTGVEPSVPAPEERDPRLAVAREVPAAREERKPEREPDRQEREDQATAVFSTKAVAEAAAEAAAGSAKGEREPEPAASGEAKGDARLRAAVAAWVATADEETPEDDAEKGGTSETSDDEGPSGDGAGDAAEASDERDDEVTDAEEGDSSDGEAASVAGASGDGADASDGADEGPDEVIDADERSSSPAENAPVAPASADSGDASEEADDADGEASASGEDAAPAEVSTAADEESSSDAEATPDDAEQAEASEAPAEDETSEDSKAVEDDAPKDDAPKDDAPKDDAPTGGVDQATAVFKALTPKAVDQPTTMLKLGDHKPEPKKPEPKKPEAKSTEKPAAKAEAKPAAKPTAKPEGDAERTSKFVALKPLDSAPKAGASGGTTGAPLPPAKAPTPEKSNAGPERTTQQPLPPKPPLDLLAELTNTPPPPETPVRTAVRRVKIWTPLVLLMVVVFAVVQAVRPLPAPTLELTAKETVSFEGGKPSMPWPSQGQAAMDVNGIGSFGTSGDQKPVPIASIAKVMTVYLILRDHPLKQGEDGPKIPVDAAAEKHYETGKAEKESVVKVTEGQKISEYEALQAVMLPSANNVAKLLARWDTTSKSEDEFVAKMNKTAKELGMKNTHYTDPSGLDKTTVSTAADLVKLGRAAMENPVFNEISRQPRYKDLNGETQKNFFGLVPTVAIGIKTGTTTAAGGNILFAAEQKVGGETRTIIGAALGQYGQNGVANIDEVTGVTRKLIEAGQSALTAKTIVKKGAVVGRVADGLGGTTPVVATKDVSAAGWSGLTVKLKLDTESGETIPHTAKAGTKVGVLSVGDGKKGAVEVPVALQKDLAEPGFGPKLKRVG